MKRLLAIFLTAVLLISGTPLTTVLAEETTEFVNPVRNPGFEEVQGDWVSGGWGRYTFEGTPYATLDTQKVHSGKNSVKISTTSGGNPHANIGISGLIPGAIYEISAFTVAELQSNGSGQGFTYKIEFRDGEGRTTGEWWADRWSDTTNEIWTKRSGVFAVPKNTVSLTLYCRIMNCNGSVWVDDVEIRYIGEPEKFTFEIGDVFHYPYEKEGVAMVHLDTFFKGNEEVENGARVDFELRDGEQVLDRKRDVTFSDMKAEYTYDIGLLKEKEKPYTVHATARYKNEEKEFTQNVYVFDRPTMIGDDNRIYYDGVIFNPVIGYHVGEDICDKLNEAGINVAQSTLLADNEAAGEQRLANFDANGIKVLALLYAGSTTAGDPNRIEHTRRVVEKFKDDPRIFAWALMDEPFAGGVTEKMQQEMELAYATVRSIDKMHPVYLCDMGPYAQKYCDISCSDSYAMEDNRSVSVRYNTYKSHKGEIHRLYLAATYESNKVMQTIKGLRGSIYRALENGAKGIGYFNIMDARRNPETREAIPLWEDDLWDPLCEFGKKELPVLNDIYVNNKYQQFNLYDDADNVEGDYWGTWTDGKVVYMIVHNRSNAPKTIEVPLKSANGLISIGDYTVELVGGTAEPVKGTESITVSLDKQDEVLYKITPSAPIALSKLNDVPFTDLEGYDWAKSEIETLLSKNVINSIAEGQFGPGKNITRADLAMFLIRTLGVQSDSTENFADIDANAYYAKELAIGKALGILKGVDALNFNPNAEISRQDMMTICHRGMELTGKTVAPDATALDKFSDKDAIAEYALDAVRSMTAAGVVEGNEDGTVNPLGNTTRAEAAVIMNRIMQTVAGSGAPAQTPAQPPAKEEPKEVVAETVTFDKEPTEKEMADWAEAKAFLTKLGIVEDSFDETAGVSRAEAAKLFSKTKGDFAEFTHEKCPFVDVPAQSQYAGYITGMNNVGYMVGVGEDQFAPEKPITYNQAVKILVKILGYDVYAENAGSYPVGYLTTASRIELLKGTTVGGDTPIRAGTLAQLIRNALEIDLVETASFGTETSGEYVTMKDRSLLTEYFNLKKYKGQLTANYYTTLEGNINPSKTQVAMGDTLFEINDSGAGAYIGQEVTIYAEDSEENKIVDISPRNAVKTLAVNGDDVLPQTSETRLAYENAEKQDRDENIRLGATLVYNGKVKSVWTKSDLMNVNGTITLVMNDGTSADVIFVDNYTNYVVDKVLEKENKVFFKNGTQKILDPNSFAIKLCMTDEKGAALELGSLEKWGILSLAESKDGKLIKAVYSNKTVQGDVSECSSEGVVVNGETYEISLTATLSPVVGKTQTFYLDFMGKIYAMDDSVNDVTYGYYTSIAQEKGLNGDVKLRIFTTGGEMKIFEAADKVDFNGTKIDEATLLTKTELIRDNQPIGQLVIYKVNAKDEVIELQTAIDAQELDREEQLNAFSIDATTGADAKAGGPFDFRGLGLNLLGSRYRVTPKTILFKVPEDNSTNVKDYGVYDYKAFVHPSNHFNAAYYDVDEDYIVSVVVEKTKNVEVVGADGTIGIINGFRTGMDAEGNIQKGISVITGAEETVLYADEDFKIVLGDGAITDLSRESEVNVVSGKRVAKDTITLDKLKMGDVVSFKKSEKGSVSGIRVLLRGDTPAIELKSEGGYYSALTRVYTPIEEVIDGGFTFTLDRKYTWMYSSDINNTPAKIVLYDKTLNEIKEISPEEVYENDKVFSVRTNPYTIMVVVYRQ